MLMFFFICAYFVQQILAVTHNPLDVYEESALTLPTEHSEQTAHTPPYL